MAKTICSIFFQPLVANRPYAKRTSGPQGFNAKYEIPAAKSGEYHLITIEDVDEQQNDGSQRKFVTPVFAEHLADDLVTEWRSNKIANEYGRPGVFVCELATPTDEELARERFIQETWCVKLVNEAEGYWVQGNRGLVSELHRAAAKYLGREAYEWVHSAGQVQLTACPFCATMIDKTAIVCKECGNTIDLDRWFQAQSRQIEMEAKLAELRKQLNVIAPETAKAVPVPPLAPPPLQPNAPKQPAR